MNRGTKYACLNFYGEASTYEWYNDTADRDSKRSGNFYPIEMFDYLNSKEVKDKFKAFHKALKEDYKRRKK